MQIITRCVHLEIDVRIIARVSSRMSTTDLEHDNLPIASVLQMMSIGVSCAEPCAVAGDQNLFARFGDENSLTLEHHEEFIFMTVPVTLAGPCAWRKTEQIDSELGETRGLSQPPPPPRLTRSVKRRRISRPMLCRRAVDLDLFQLTDSLVCRPRPKSDTRRSLFTQWKLELNLTFGGRDGGTLFRCIISAERQRLC